VSRWFLTSRILKTTAGVVAGPSLYLAVAVAASGAAGWGVSLLTTGMPSLVALVLIALAVLIVHLVATRLLAPQVIPQALTMLGRSRIGGRIPYVRRFRGDG
jgi:hypothetical protein